MFRPEDWPGIPRVRPTERARLCSWAKLALSSELSGRPNYVRRRMWPDPVLAEATIVGRHDAS
jgi:hypothetical protein